MADPVVALPRFLQPPQLRTDPAQPEMEHLDLPGPPPATDNPTPGASLAGGVDSSGAPSTPKADRVPTRTGSSSPDFNVTPKQAAVLLVGIGGLVAGVVAWGVRARWGRQLRRPTQEQLHDIAEPLARIWHRRWPEVLGRFGVDVSDVILAGSAAGVYLNDGPLTAADLPDPGVPTDLQEEMS